MDTALGNMLMEGSKRYPYARTCATDMFGMTPDDYRLDGWTECVPHTVNATLEELAAQLRRNMKRCNVERVFGSTYGAGYRQAVEHVLELIDDLKITEDNDAEQMD